MYSYCRRVDELILKRTQLESRKTEPERALNGSKKTILCKIRRLELLPDVLNGGSENYLFSVVSQTSRSLRGRLPRSQTSDGRSGRLAVTPAVWYNLQTSDSQRMANQRTCAQPTPSLSTVSRQEGRRKRKLTFQTSVSSHRRRPCRLDINPDV